MDRIMTMVAALVPVNVRIRKNRGRPISAPPPKHTNCLLVRPNMTLLLTFDKSFGTGI